MPLDNRNYLEAFKKPDGYTPYAAGPKLYGMGRTNPNEGPASVEGSTGYMERDVKARARKEAMKRRLAQAQAGQYPAYGGPQ